MTSTIFAAAVAALSILLGPVCVNYPYPSWFCIALGLSMVLLENAAWWKKANTYRLVAGGLAGMMFSFKVNWGVFAFAALVLIQSLEVMLPSENVRPAQCKATRWLVPVVALLLAVPVGSIVLIRHHLTLVNLFVFSVPALSIAVIGLGQLVKRIKDGNPLNLIFSPITFSIIGFAAIVMPWMILFLIRLGASGFYEALIYPPSLMSVVVYRALPAPTLASSLLVLLCTFQGIMIIRKGTPVYIKSAFLVVLGSFELFLAYKMIPFVKEGLAGAGTSLYSKWGFGLASYIPLAVHIGIAFVLSRDYRDIEKAGRKRIHLLFSLWIYSVLAFHVFYPLMEPHHLIWNMAPVIVLGGVFLFCSMEFWEVTSSQIFPSFRKGLRLCSALLVPVFLMLFFGLPFFSYFVKVNSSPFAVRFAEFSDIDTPRGGILMPRPMASGMSETIRYITSHTESDEYIFDATGSLFYFLTDRRNPTRWGYFWDDFLSSQDVAEIMQRLETVSPKVAVISYAADLHLSLNQPDLYAYIRARYRPVKTFGDYQVLALSER